MELKYKDIVLPISKVQNALNHEVVNKLNNHNIDYWGLTNKQKHKALSKCINVCQKCDHIRKGNITPSFISEPDMIVVGRSCTKKDSKYNAIISEDHPTYSVIKNCCVALNTNIQNIYYTNTCFCVTSSVNDITSQSCKNCFLYKDLELDNIKLPKIFLLLGNDAFNSFFDLGCTVQHILGNVYASIYKGEYRLFIPIPHPVNLLRDKLLYKTTMLFLLQVNTEITNGLLGRLGDDINN